MKNIVPFIFLGIAALIAVAIAVVVIVSLVEGGAMNDTANNLLHTVWGTNSN